ncbi:hypothetical protein QGM71_18235 [Virgibacillus sp. C22-A2]|uniref:GNAT family N-acetyltransferase n=1 Tax=Virgibacillus tibetensis TaxID=3042313 RepID=A0ABU6KJQ6_9BACI|nr:hypothetical protein [Virgibacillus sp. C22-A2]
MNDFRRVDINTETDFLLKMSALQTTYLSVNPYLDNRELILKKLNRNEIDIFSFTSNRSLEGVFLIKKIPYNNETAYIDYLAFSSDGDQEVVYLLDFLNTIYDIFNISKFIKCEEINDLRVTSFRKVGFNEAAKLREHQFYNGNYFTQKLYFLDVEDALFE